MATAASLNQVQNIYIAFYGRPADPEGQVWWATELDAANGDLHTIIDAFANSDEYDSQYGNLDTPELINALYQQIFGRDADSAGLDFYANQLNSGALTTGQIALSILDGAQGDDAVVLQNRKVVADNFTAAVEAADKEYGNAQLADAKSLLASVSAYTDPASVDVNDVVDTFPGGDDEPVDPTEPSDVTVIVDQNVTGTDGIAETFVYSIDSSSGEAVSLAGGDFSIAGFNIEEDTLVFDDVESGTLTLENFGDLTPTISESGINSLTDIIFSDDSQGNAYMLTLTGIVDQELSSVDFSII